MRSETLVCDTVFTVTPWVTDTEKWVLLSKGERVALTCNALTSEVVESQGIISQRNGKCYLMFTVPVVVCMYLYVCTVSCTHFCMAALSFRELLLHTACVHSDLLAALIVSVFHECHIFFRIFQDFSVFKICQRQHCWSCSSILTCLW